MTTGDDERMNDMTSEAGITTPTPRQVLDLPLGENDADAATVRGFLVALTRKVWEEQEGFDGKRPWGDSAWDQPVRAALVRAGYVAGGLDAYDGVDWLDRGRAAALMDAALGELGRVPDADAARGDEGLDGDANDGDDGDPDGVIAAGELEVQRALRAVTGAYARERGELRRRNAELAEWLAMVCDSGLAPCLDRYAAWVEENGDDVETSAGTTPPGEPAALRAWADLLRRAPRVEAAG